MFKICFFIEPNVNQADDPDGPTPSKQIKLSI